MFLSQINKNTYPRARIKNKMKLSMSKVKLKLIPSATFKVLAKGSPFWQLFQNTGYLSLLILSFCLTHILQQTLLVLPSNHGYPLNQHFVFMLQPVWSF